MNNLLLTFHIIGAVLLGISMLAGLCMLLFSQSNKSYLRTIAIFVAVQTGLQLLSGSFLAFQKGVILSPLAFCKNILLYVVVVLLFEFVLFRKLTMAGEFTPTKQVFAPIGAGVLSAIVALLILT